MVADACALQTHVNTQAAGRHTHTHIGHTVVDAAAAVKNTAEAAATSAAAATTNTIISVPIRVHRY